MAYIKQTWVDQEGQVRYTETTDGDYKIFTPNYEEVTVIGTPVNAVNMNHIENGIGDVDTTVRASRTISISGAVVGSVSYTLADNDTLNISTTMPSKVFTTVSQSLSAGVQTSLSSVLPDDGQMYFIWIANSLSVKSNTAYQTSVQTDVFPTTTFNTTDGDDGRESKARSLICVPVGEGRYVTVSRASTLIGYMKA